MTDYSHEYFIDGALAIFGVTKWTVAGALHGQPDPLSLADATTAVEDFVGHSVEPDPGTTPPGPDDRHVVLVRGVVEDGDLLVRDGDAFVAIDPEDVGGPGVAVVFEGDALPTATLGHVVLQVADAAEDGVAMFLGQTVELMDS